MTKFVNLDAISEQRKSRGFTYQGETYQMKPVSVGMLIKLNEITSTEEDQDIEAMIDLIVGCFPKLNKEMCLDFEQDQLMAIITLVTGSFEEADDDAGKKTLTSNDSNQESAPKNSYG